MASLHDAGYVLARFREEATDPFEQRILETELTRTGIPYILGNPLVSGALKAFGTPEQRRRYLPAMARGDDIWTQLFSEPNAGSDLTALQTRARRDGDDYIVDGQKVWSTWAPFADYGYLLARTEPDPGPRGITAFVLDMRSPGVETRPLREMTGTADFSEVFFDAVRVPAANLIGATGEGWKVANTSLAAERGGVGELGSDDALRGLVRLAWIRRRAGRPAIEDSAVRQQIAVYVARGADPALPRIPRGHEGSPRRDRGLGRTADEGVGQRAQPGDGRVRARAPGHAVGTVGRRPPRRRRRPVAGCVPLRVGVDDRRRIQRDHAQPHRRTRARFAAEAARHVR